MLCSKEGMQGLPAQQTLQMDVVEKSKDGFEVYVVLAGLKQLASLL